MRVANFLLLSFCLFFGVYWFFPTLEIIFCYSVALFLLLLISRNIAAYPLKVAK